MKKQKAVKVKKEETKKRSPKKLINAFPTTVVAISISLVICIILFFYNHIAAISGLFILTVFVLVFTLGKNFELRQLQIMVKLIRKKFSPDEDGELHKFPLPVVVISGEEKIVWYNTPFEKEFLQNIHNFSTDIKEFTKGKGLEFINNNNLINCEYNGKFYTAVSGSVEYKKEKATVLYFMEDTELKHYKARFQNSRPVVMLVSFDTIDEYLGDYRESQQAEILSGVDAVIENWISSYDNCIAKKLLSGRFVVFTEKYVLKQMIDNKFDILSKVRAYTYNDKQLGLTVSIGVGTDENINRCENAARQALDMALGRGGDQVAVKIGENDYEFFGGVTKGVEKRNKVKTRIVAAAIMETIKQSSNVLIMGHRFADLDALGSSVGVSKICKTLGKDAKIIMSKKTTLAMPLAEHLQNNGLTDLIIEPSDADKLLDDKTLLFIVDAHRQSFLEYPDIFERAKSVIVVDHHRKTVDHINKAMVFYHEPNASSASEMVTELIEYMTENITLSKTEAEALLSGIMLDTKNFVMNTGVRTFEAAAYLRSMGADTVAVKQLFANSMETQKSKSRVVKNAAMYKNCAVGVVDFDTDDIRIVASQAADELLNVSQIAASFVIFKSGKEIDISARSYGEINVQLVMEELGGGGHQTMAAAQLPDKTFDEAFSMLKDAIDKVTDTNTK